MNTKPNDQPTETAPLTAKRCEELAISLFKKYEELDPTDEGDCNAPDWGWSKIPERDRHLYRSLVDHMLRELNIERDGP